MSITRVFLHQVTRFGVKLAKLGLFSMGQSFTGPCGHQLTVTKGLWGSDCKTCGINIEVSEVQAMYFSATDYARRQEDHARYPRMERPAAGRQADQHQEREVELAQRRRRPERAQRAPATLLLRGLRPRQLAQPQRAVRLAR